jgi:hypothetical protein
MIYYVIMINDSPEFVETDKERAETAKGKLQRQLDIKDGVTSSWQRKRFAKVKETNGVDVEQSASGGKPVMEDRQPIVIQGEVIKDE